MADRVGVVGANPNRGWARDSHIPALRSLENVPLAAVATTSRASADAAAEAIGVGAGYDDPRCVVPCGVCVDRLIRRRVQVHVDCLSVSFGPTVGRPLLTAALAADHHLTLVHYDADFDTAATVLEFQHQWVLREPLGQPATPRSQTDASRPARPVGAQRLGCSYTGKATYSIAAYSTAASGVIGESTWTSPQIGIAH